MATRMFIKGRLISEATITGGTRAANGTITYGTGASVHSLTGKLAGVSFSAATVRATINSLDDLIVHEEILMDGVTCQVQEIMTTTGDVPTGAGGNRIALQDIFYNFDFAVLVLTAGGRKYTFKGTRGDLTTGVSSAGENIVSLTIQSINDGNVSPLTLANVP
jgi:hypothetical protein